MAYGNKFGTEVDRIGKDGLLYYTVSLIAMIGPM